MSLVSLYYYLMVIRQMYIEPVPEPVPPVTVPRLTFGILSVLFVGIVLLGVYPAVVMDFIQSASDALLSTEFALSFR